MTARAGLGLLLVLLFAFWLALLSGLPAQAQSSVRAPDTAVNTFDDPNADGPPNTLGTESRSAFWSALKQGEIATTSSSTADGKAMQTIGQEWRLFRTQYILKYSGWVLVAVVGLLMLYYLIRGPMKIKDGRSGKMVHRFSTAHRVAHWFIAFVFLFLALSGFVIMLGRPVLTPIIGRDANAVLTSAALQGHNLFGPLFIFGLIWIFVKFVRGNFFQMVDFKWIFKLGGLFGGHVSSKKFNFGEKSWFWLLVIVGSVMSISGLIMLFPWLFEDLRFLQVSTILHAFGAVTLLAVALGHIYIGSVGMEGSLDSMVKGEVDENWAKEHHDLWYEEVVGKTAAAKSGNKGESA